MAASTVDPDNEQVGGPQQATQPGASSPNLKHQTSSQDKLKGDSQRPVPRPTLQANSAR